MTSNSDCNIPISPSFRRQSFFFFFVARCSAQTSTQCFFLNFRMKPGSLKPPMSKKSWNKKATVKRCFQNLPKLRGNTQVFTASHQGIAFAALWSSWQTRIIEKVLLSPSLRNKSGYQSSVFWKIVMIVFMRPFLTFHDISKRILVKHFWAISSALLLVQDPILQGQMPYSKCADIWFRGDIADHLKVCYCRALQNKSLLQPE